MSVTADLSRVGVTCEGRTMAEHARSCARHQTFIDPEHAAAAVALRRAQIEAARPPRHTEVEVRDLTSYDTLLGVEAGTGTATGGVA